MKTRYFNVIALLSWLSIFIFFNQKVYADVDYDVNNVNVTAEVNKDGSLTMQQKIDYYFNSDAHGLYYKQNLDKKQELSNIKVKVNGKNLFASTTENNNTYELQKHSHSYRFKVFHRVSEDEKVRVEYSYVIHNAITNYKDTAELNFMIIGNGWDVDLDHVKAKVIFPNSVKGLKAWVHGPLNGNTQVLPKKGEIIMTASDVPGDIGIEVHSIFPTKVTSTNMNYIAKNKKKAIEKQEAKLATEANQKRHQQQTVNYSLLIISLILAAVTIIKGFATKKAGVQPRKENDLAHNYDILTVSPVVAQILDEANKPNVKAFTAYLVQLAGKNKIKIEDYQTKYLKKQNYRITFVDEEILQDDLLDFIFKKVGDGKSFTTKDLRNYMSKKLGKHFDKWRTKQYDLVQKAGLLDKELERKSNNYKMAMVVLIVFSMIFTAAIIFMFNNGLLRGFTILNCGLLILKFVAYFVGKRRISIYTRKGAIETEKVRSFKKMLNDVGRFKMKDVGDLILWEDIMPYAGAFGLSKKVLKQLKIEFSNESEDSTFILASYYSLNDTDFERVFEKKLF